MGEQILVIQYIGAVWCGVFFSRFLLVAVQCQCRLLSINISAQDFISLGGSAVPQQGQFHRCIGVESYQQDWGGSTVSSTKLYSREPSSIWPEKPREQSST